MAGKSVRKARETLMLRSPRKRASRTIGPAAILRDARKRALLQRQRPSRCAGMRFGPWQASATADAISLAAPLEPSSSLDQDNAATFCGCSAGIIAKPL